MLFRKPVNVNSQQQQPQQQQLQQPQQQIQPSNQMKKSQPANLTLNPSLNHLGTPANDDVHSPTPKRVTIVEGGVSTPTRPGSSGGGGGGGGAGSGSDSRTTKSSGSTTRNAVSNSSPPPTPPNYNNRNGQPPNVPPSRLKDPPISALKNSSLYKDNATNPTSNSSNNQIANIGSNPISGFAPPIHLTGGGKTASFTSAYDEEDQFLPGGAGGPGSIISSARRPSAPRGSSIESGGSGSGSGGGPTRQNSRPENGAGIVGVGGGLGAQNAYPSSPTYGSPGIIPGGVAPGYGGPLAAPVFPPPSGGPLAGPGFPSSTGGPLVGPGIPPLSGGPLVGSGIPSPSGVGPGFGVTFAPSTKSEEDDVIPGPRSRSVERDLDEFVRSCSVARTPRAKSVATARTAEGEECLSRLDALINDVVNTSTTPSTTVAATSRGRSRGRSPGVGGGVGGGGGGGAGRSSSLMARSAYDAKSFGVMPSDQQQQQQRGRSMLRDAEIDRLQRDVTSMTRSTTSPRGLSVTRDFGAGREFSVARELSMGREFAAPVESTVSKVYVSSLEPSDKICMKVRAAIQREVTMTNKKVDLVWNKIQTLKETNDIMEETICQTEDELCYCEELTDAVGLDLTDILTDAEDREQLLNYELQLLQEMRRVEEEEGEDGDVDGPLGEDGGEGVEGAEGDPLQKKKSLLAMKKKAQKKFTRLKRRDSEDIMNSTKCKIS